MCATLIADVNVIFKCTLRRVGPSTNDCFGIFLCHAWWLYKAQGDYVGFNTENGEKLSYSQAETGQVSPFPVFYPT